MSRYGLIALFVFSLLSSVSAAPINRREVPQGKQSAALMTDWIRLTIFSNQEHSHEAQLRAVRTLLQANNPNQIQDPVFGLLGNAAAAAGAGKITVSDFALTCPARLIKYRVQDLDCLQMFTADQAFTNAKAANDVEVCLFVERVKHKL